MTTKVFNILQIQGLVVKIVILTAPTPATWFQCSPLASIIHHSPPAPTSQLWRPPFATSAHQLQKHFANPAISREWQWIMFYCFGGSDTHHSVWMLTTDLRRPPLGSGTNHSASMPTTRLQHSRLGSSTHHSPLVLTTCIRHPPLASSTHHSIPAPATQLRQHSQTKQYLYYGSGSDWKLLCLMAPAGLHSTLMLTTGLRHPPLATGTYRLRCPPLATSSAHQLPPSPTTQLQSTAAVFVGAFIAMIRIIVNIILKSMIVLHGSIVQFESWMRKEEDC